MGKGSDIFYRNIRGATLSFRPPPRRHTMGRNPAHPLTQMNCFSAATTATRSDWFAMTSSMSL